VVRVADNGVGIRRRLEADRRPFLSGRQGYQRRHEGTGLGLSIVKKPGPLHGGEMTVQSRIDEGTTVAIALPLVFTPPAEQPASNIATLNPGARPDIRPKRIR